MKYLRLLTVLSTLCAIGRLASAQPSTTPPPASIIPEPVSTKWGHGNFNLNANTVIVADASDQPSVQFFSDYLNKLYRLHLNVVRPGQKPAGNYIWLDPGGIDDQATSINEARYSLDVSSDHIKIHASFHPGIFYGIQTLIQLLPLSPFTATPTGYAIRSTNGLTIPAVTIDDYPRFAWRGLHLDCGRHFFPVEFVKRC